MSSPTQRSLAYVRGGDWTAEVVEKTIRIPRGRTFKRDLFGCADILAWKAGRRPLLVQTTDATSVSKHLAKILALPHLRELLAVFTLEVHGWAKPTKMLRKYRLRVVTIQQTTDGVAVVQDGEFLQPLRALVTARGE